MAKVTASDVRKARITIELGPEGETQEYTLIPSPEAILSLSMKYDGFAPLMAAIARLNIQAMIDTVVAGLDLKGPAARDIAAKVAVSPIIDELLPKLSEFASILANGGRPMKPVTPEDEGGCRPL